MASLWTYEEVYYFLQSGVATQSQLKTLSSFLTANLADLQLCCQHICDPTVLGAVRFEEESRKNSDVHKAATEATKTKIAQLKTKQASFSINGASVKVSDEALKDAELVLGNLNVSVDDAIRVVMSFPYGGNDDNKRLRLYTNRILSERQFKVKVVSTLFYKSSALSKPVEDEKLALIIDEYARKIYSKSGFASHVMQEMVRNANLVGYCRREKDPLVAGKKGEGNHEILGVLRYESHNFLLELLKLTYITYYFGPTNPSAKDVQEWFECLDQVPFMQNYSDLYSYSILISLVLLDLDQQFDIPTDQDDRIEESPESLPSIPDNVYFKDPKTLSAINNIILEHLGDAFWSPIILAWSHVFQRVAIRQEETDDQALVPLIQDIDVGPYAYCKDLAVQAMRNNVLLVTQNAYRGLDKKVPEHSMVFMSLCRANFGVLPLSESFSQLVATLMDPYPDYSRYLLENTVKFRDVLLVALSRCPFNIEPFLNIMMAMDGQTAFSEIYQMSTFMHQLFPGFKDYTFSETDTSVITLTGDIEIFEEFSIPAGTSGTLVPGDNIPPLVMWATPFNGWSYLGRVLSEVGGRSAALIIKLIRTVIEKIGDIDAAEELLRSASLWSEEDVVEVIAKHLIDAYANQHLFVASECVKFFVTLGEFQPGRIWPFLSRSGILAQHGRSGLASMVLGSTEIVNGEYSLTLGLLDLADTLVGHAVSVDSSVSAKVQSDVLLKLTRHFIDVFESCSYWKYVNKDQRVEVMSKSVRMFQKIVHFTYSMDNVVPVLQPSAEYILESFLASSGEGLGPQRPLLACLESTSVEWVNSALEFLTKIVKVRTHLELPPSVLEKKLFLASPGLVEVYQQFPFHKKVIDLLTALVESSWIDSDQPSLLAHLGQYHSQLLLKSLISALENSLETTESIISICSFFGAVVNGSSRQDGLSILLVAEKGSLLEVIEKRALETTEYNSRTFVHISKAISLARNTWSTVTKTSKERLVKLVEKMIDVVDSVPLQLPQELRSPKKASNKSVTVEVAYQRFSAAKAVQVVAQELFKDPETVGSVVKKRWGDSILLKMTKSFSSIQLYRSSLHGNLVRNFQSKFDRELFQFTKKDPRKYGGNFVYDLDDMQAVFGHSLGEFHNEISEANLNLSLVNSETELSLAWGQFLVVAVDVKIVSNLADIVLSLLDISLGGMIAPVFEPVYHARLEVIFHIIKSAKNIDITEALRLCWAILESTDISFLASLSSDRPKLLYKPVLRSISILVEQALQKPETDMAQVLHGISDIVLCKGSSVLSSALQSSNCQVDLLIEDLRIMVVLLRNFLAFEHSCVPISLAQFALKIQDTGSIRSLLSLYSFSQEIDPVFGELTLLFLLELVQNDQLSEQVVLNGLIGALTEAPISREIQKGGLNQGRMYHIWIRGILPIMLSVLVKLGGRISPEISMLLTFFQQQLETAVRNLMEPIAVSLSFVDELQQIVVLLQVVPNELKDTYKPAIMDGINYLQKHPKLLASLTTVGNSAEQQLHEDIGSNGVSKLVTKILDRLEEVSTLCGGYE